MLFRSTTPPIIISPKIFLKEPRSETLLEVTLLKKLNGTYDPYFISHCLGHGSGGSVFQAQTPNYFPCAIKFYNKTYTEKEISDMMKSNSQFVGVKNPNVAEVFALYPRARCIVLELLKGPNLEELISKKRPDLPMILRICLGTLSGLSYIHEKGLVHRDIKPQNIIIARKGECDIAKIIDHDLVCPKGTPRDSLGTMIYLSPEQAKSKSTPLDQKSDIFSLGLVLMRMGLATDLFYRSVRVGNSVYENIDARAECILSLPQQLNENYPSWLVELISACLSKDPFHRPTANELLSEIRKKLFFISLHKKLDEDKFG